MQLSKEKADEEELYSTAEPSNHSKSRKKRGSDEQSVAWVVNQIVCCLSAPKKDETHTHTL